MLKSNINCNVINFIILRLQSYTVHSKFYFKFFTFHLVHSLVNNVNEKQLIKCNLHYANKRLETTWYYVIEHFTGNVWKKYVKNINIFIPRRNRNHRGSILLARGIIITFRLYKVTDTSVSRFMSKRAAQIINKQVDNN